MLRFACKDLGVPCEFVARGATVQEVKDQAFAHANVVHAEMLKAMSEAEMAQMIQALEASIKPG